MQEPSERKTKKKAQKLGETSVFRPLVPLARALSPHNQPEPETNIPSPSQQPPPPPSELHIETPTENPISHHYEPPIETISTPPEPTSPTSELEPAFPTLEEAERLAREAEEKARREAKEKARLEEEQRAREAVEKAASEDVVAAEAEDKEKADVEEAAHIAAEEAAKARNDALTQGEQSHSDFAPLMLKILEELQQEQQIYDKKVENTNNFDEIISKPVNAMRTFKTLMKFKAMQEVSKVKTGYYARRFGKNI
ncbi:eukaryotic translation initiation factor 4 gamma-like [Lathyrus oleraceus]|uniref:eukaryotic translation initiation factor 4 gamma-like n=1 Tax=Pisum sativum TaxID=3888 RepID=UPI0021D12C5F|nr:eukaryotic translation initiation factor 4 gamma-like [Pisum sativum]